MDFKSLSDELGLSPGEMARELGVSTGHVADLRKGRRKLSLKLAAKLESKRPGLIADVLARKMA